MAASSPYQLDSVFPQLRLQQPLYLTDAGDGSGRLFVVEKAGRVRVFDPAAPSDTGRVFLDLSDVVRDFRPETGLLGLAFHPDYEFNGRFFVHYSGASFRSFISEFHVSADPHRAERGSERVVLELRQPTDKHNGGQLAFGPDGYLYAGFGDGGLAEDRFAAAQDRSGLLGAIIRLDVNAGEPYAIPPDNPFVDNEQGWREEIWAWGFRNPWRFSFDPLTGELWVGDVGEEDREEIDVVEKGRNYGWGRMEGTRCIDPAGCDDAELTPPLFEYSHSEGVAILGGYVYRGPRLPELHGAYLYADFDSRKVWALRRDDDRILNELIAVAPSQLTSFGRDDAGEVYILGIDGAVLRLRPSTPEAPPPMRLSDTGIFSDMASQIPASGVLPYEINAPLWSDGAGKRRYLVLPRRGRIGFDARAPWSLPAGTILVKSFYLGDRIVETRLLVRRSDREAWDGYSYVWDDDGTGAFLLEGRHVGVYDGRSHYFPSRHECGQCHTRAAGFVLGLRTGQVDRDGQIRAWERAGVFTGELPGGEWDRWPASDDESAQPTLRARAYLAANCSQCHRPGHFTRADLDLRFSTHLQDTGLLRAATLGGPHERIVVPGHPDRSAIYHRIRSLDVDRMPPLASSRVDSLGSEIVSRWIAALLRPTAVAEPEGRPTEFALLPPYPNPFNSEVVITYRLVVAESVRLDLFDLAGQRLESLVNGERSAGTHHARWHGNGRASGVYIVRLSSGSAIQTRKIVLVR